MGLTKLTIDVSAKDTAIRGEVGLDQKLELPLNPTEYALDKGASYAEVAIPGLDQPILQFTNGTTEKLSFEAVLDGTSGEFPVDVPRVAAKLDRLVRIASSTHAPPRLTVSWGDGNFTASQSAFDVVLESVQTRFILFDRDGKPLRARVSLSFRRYKSLDDQLQTLNLKSNDHSRNWEVQQGDRLDWIAFVAYGDPTLWRFIAEDPENRSRILDPRRLAPGTRLRLPVLDPRQGGRTA